VPSGTDLTRVGLFVLSSYDFALASGDALKAHRLVDWLSEDIDPFTNSWDPNEFSRAIGAVRGAYRSDGLQVEVHRRADTFARIQVTNPGSSRVDSVDLAADLRQLEPVQLSVRPVLAERDAVASKAATVFSRGAARDDLDLAGILDSGRLSRPELMRLGGGIRAPRLVHPRSLRRRSGAPRWRGDRLDAKHAKRRRGRPSRRMGA
jgi:hypothetical protein